MKKLSSKIRKAFQGGSRGVTLIEVLVALALFAIIGIAFAGGLGTASRAVLIGDIRTNAESLARTQMESVKNQAYNYTEDENVGIYSKIDIPDERYSICSVNITTGQPIMCENSNIIAIPWNSGNNTAAETDTGLQKITLVIKHEGKYIITLEGYKVKMTE